MTAKEIVEKPELDVVVRLVPEDEAPPSFWLMPRELRSQRARLYLICRCAATDPVLAWAWAMDMSDEGCAFAAEIGGRHTDAEIEDAVRREFGSAGL